jgi:hypothetical protein
MLHRAPERYTDSPPLDRVENETQVSDARVRMDYPPVPTRIEQLSGGSSSRPPHPARIEPYSIRPRSPSGLRRLGLDVGAAPFVPAGPAPPSPPTASSQAWLAEYDPYPDFDLYREEEPAIEVLAHIPSEARIQARATRRADMRRRREADYDDDAELEREWLLRDQMHRSERASGAAGRTGRSTTTNDQESLAQDQEFVAMFGMFHGEERNPTSHEEDYLNYPNLYESTSAAPQPRSYGITPGAIAPLPLRSYVERQREWVHSLQNPRLDHGNEMVGSRSHTPVAQTIEARDTRRDGVVISDLPTLMGLPRIWPE